jgi:hypothetical protein
VMIASTPTDVLTFLATFETQRAGRLPAGPQKDQLLDAIGIARGLATQLPAELTTVDLPKAGPGPPARLLTRIEGLALQLQRILTLATQGVHTGTPEDPIPIDFFKSMRRYRPVRLTVNGRQQTAWAHEVTPLPVPMELEHMTDSGGEVRIGVDSEYQPEAMRDRRKPLRRTEEDAETQDARVTAAVRDFRTLLTYFQFDWADTAGDHVHDLALGGYDGKENLWPLDSATNLASNAVYRQEVIHRDPSTTEVRTDTVGELRGKWFVIVRIV